MAAPTTLYVKDSSADEWRILSGITNWAKCIIPVTGLSYRNTGWTPGTADVSNMALVSINGLPAGGAFPAAIGTLDTSTTPDSYAATLTGITHANLPDEMTNTPYHQWRRMESATVFAFNGETLPAVGATQSITSANTTTNVITKVAHGLASGDIVSITTSGTIMPCSPAIVAGQLFTVLVLDADTFKLLDNGVAIAITTSPTANSVVMVTPASLLNGQFVFILDSNNPSFSVGDPR